MKAPELLAWPAYPRRQIEPSPSDLVSTVIECRPVVFLCRPSLVTLFYSFHTQFFSLCFSRCIYAQAAGCPLLSCSSHSSARLHGCKLLPFTPSLTSPVHIVVALKKHPCLHYFLTFIKPQNMVRMWSLCKFLMQQKRASKMMPLEKVR